MPPQEPNNAFNFNVGLIQVDISGSLFGCWDAKREYRSGVILKSEPSEDRGFSDFEGIYPMNFKIPVLAPENYH
jgi:hypothetical protein